MDNLRSFYGPNAGYVLDLYERYRQDPTSVDPDTRAIFAIWSPTAPSIDTTTIQSTVERTPFNVAHIVAASALAHAIRERGHLGAHLDPLGTEPLGDPALLPES
jgi:2-oxoglutarate dehydrogenase E1 component